VWLCIQDCIVSSYYALIHSFNVSLVILTSGSALFEDLKRYPHFIVSANAKSLLVMLDSSGVQSFDISDAWEPNPRDA
jgi:hypothetical protein